MYCADRRNKELSRALRVMVHQDLDERSKRATWPGIDRESNQRKVSKQLETSEKGWTSFRCTVNIEGRNAVQCWTPNKVKRSLPESWRDCKITPKLYFKGLYVMGRDMGAVIELTHATVEELEQQCPFE